MVQIGLLSNSPEFLKPLRCHMDQACQRAEVQKNVQIESSKWN